MKTITIRPFVGADRARLIKLIDSVAGEGKHLPVASYSSTPQWDAALAGRLDGGLILLAEVGNEPIGWCRLFPQNEEAVELGIGMAAPYRGKGIGGEMLRVCMEWARKNGYQRIVLDTMESNTVAQEFFRRHGFVEKGQEPRRIGGGEPYEAVLMELEL